MSHLKKMYDDRKCGLKYSFIKSLAGLPSFKIF